MNGENARGPGVMTWSGLGLLGAAAAILTFSTLRDLAISCGITATFLGIPLAWLLPITVDAAGVVAIRVWLTRRASNEALLLARRLSWTCVALSVLGNAGQHGMAAYDLTAPWWVIVLVSAVPAAMLGAVVHLAVLLTRDDNWNWTQDPEPEEEAPAAPTPEPAAPDPEPDAAEPEEGAAEDAVLPAVALPAAMAPGAAADELLPQLRAWAAAEGVPSKRKVIERFSVGSARAGKLLAALDEPHTNGHARPELVSVK